MRQAKTDIDAVYSMGLFDDVTILPQPSDDSTPDQPKANFLPAAFFRDSDSMPMQDVNA